MKKLLLATLALIGLSANAQYYQHIYGSPDDDYLTSGINTVVQPAGHFMASQAKACQGVYSTIPAAYTNMAGNIPGPPFFQNDYMLIDATGNVLHAKDAQVFEGATGFGFGIIGMYFDPCNPNTSGVFYLQLDPLGNPLATYNYPALAAGGLTYSVTEVGGIEKSVISGPNDVFVTGTVTDNTGIQSVFAMRLNEVGGGIVWSQIYNILPPINGSAWGKDVAENIASPFGVPSIAVAGMVNSNWSGIFQDDGLIMHIDAATGLAGLHPVIISGTPNTHDHFNSIDQAVGGPFPPGFILGGGTMVNGNMDFYILRMDPVVATMYTNSFDYSFFPGVHNDCYDVIERLNTACQYEYYAVGYTANGALGGSDAMVVKMDQFGNAVPLGEYTYGGGGNDYGRMLDQLNTGAPCAPPPMAAPAGLSVYGTWGSAPTVGGNTDMYAIKAYYNGISGCNEIFNNPLQLPANPTMPHSPIITVSSFGMGTLLNFMVPINNLTLCFNPVIGGGNNNKVANPEKGENEGPKQDVDQKVVLMPNPTENGVRTVALKIESEIAGEAEVAIYDMLGKQYYIHKFNLLKGVNQLPIDISETNMATGTYTVKISSNTIDKNVLLMIK